ncbi:MAG: sterol desaturase [Rhodospirillaceae bacterium]|nr:sterol desaturase [Rhodospirillaceae bacterium]|tara:strand:+ start:2194 stop:3210 length:1017 start_codon:yes stop_codon:yes gene_type:complete
MIIDWVTQEYLPLLVDSFTNPQKRVSVGYLLVAIVVALIWSAWVSKSSWRKGASEGFKNILGRAVIFSRSARADYKLLLVNQAIMLAMTPLFVTKLAVATALFMYMHETIPAGSAFFGDVSVWTVSIIYTVFLFVLDDFSRFAVHYCLHRVPCLWAFHKTHHSAETLTPFTVYRTHPIEGVLFSFRGIFVQAISISLFVFFFGDRVDLVSIYGVNALLFIFNVTGANLRHSHIRIRYGAGPEHIFMSPAQHQIHHSIAPEHHDRNFGAALAIWDWLSGTLYISKKEETVSFGLEETPEPNAHDLATLYFAPFAEIFHSFVDRIPGLRSGEKKDVKHAI